MKNKIAYCIRILTVPPLTVLSLLLILRLRLGEEFASPAEFLVLIALMCFVPVSAYPLQKILPEYKSAGRKAQRKLAFLFTLFGYAAAMLWAVIGQRGAVIRAVTVGYFCGVVLLTVLNVFARFKASGHACSFTAAVLLAAYFAGKVFILPGVLLGTAVYWSCARLKRHTLPQLAVGTLTAVAAFCFAVLFAVR